MLWHCDACSVIIIGLLLFAIYRQYFAEMTYPLGDTQVYIPKRRTLIQVLPPANAYTKLFAICSCIFTYPFVCHSCIYEIRPACVHHGVCLIAILNAYMHVQITKEYEGRKYLYECTPFGYVNLCYVSSISHRERKTYSKIIFLQCMIISYFVKFLPFKLKTLGSSVRRFNL